MHVPFQVPVGDGGNSSQESHQAKLKKLAFYRSEIKHEFTLLSNRVNAYVTSQSFLCIAFASAMGNTNPHWGSTFTLVFPVALALLGVATSVRAHESIAAAADTIALWHVKQHRLFQDDPAMEDYRVHRPGTSSDPDSPVDRVHERSLVFSRLAPRIFLLAWCVFGVMAVLLHFVA